MALACTVLDLGDFQSSLLERDWYTSWSREATLKAVLTWCKAYVKNDLSLFDAVHLGSSWRSQFMALGTVVWRFGRCIPPGGSCSSGKANRRRGAGMAEIMNGQNGPLLVFATPSADIKEIVRMSLRLPSKQWISGTGFYWHCWRPRPPPVCRQQKRLA